MKQYRLLKKYPGLPPSWEVGMILIEKSKPYTSAQKKYTPKNNKYYIRHIESSHVENHPEFWEKVAPYYVLTNNANGKTYNTVYLRDALTGESTAIADFYDENSWDDAHAYVEYLEEELEKKFK